MSTDNRPDLTLAVVAASASNPDATGSIALLRDASATIHWIGPGPTKDLWRAYDVRRGIAEDLGLDVARLRRFVEVLRHHEHGPDLLVVDVKGADRRALGVVDAATMRTLAEVLWVRTSGGEMMLTSAFT